MQVPSFPENQTKFNVKYCHVDTFDTLRQLLVGFLSILGLDIPLKPCGVFYFPLKQLLYCSD